MDRRGSVVAGFPAYFTGNESDAEALAKFRSARRAYRAAAVRARELAAAVVSGRISFARAVRGAA